MNMEKLNDAFVEAMYQIMINTSDVATAEKAYENARYMIKGDCSEAKCKITREELSEIVDSWEKK
ncbi:hypothetical protein [Klebsiella quasivariicola]|uniref:hypothetical protein n=1 Tax=Klebsiella quasivariicola TaxID=2026240 RepID=UPI0024791AA1|nr:hypothetical protein [Klebsiella quasivariicola]